MRFAYLEKWRGIIIATTQAKLFPPPHSITAHACGSAHICVSVSNGQPANWNTCTVHYFTLHYFPPHWWPDFYTQPITISKPWPHRISNRSRPPPPSACPTSTPICPSHGSTASTRCSPPPKSRSRSQSSTGPWPFAPRKSIIHRARKISGQ